MEDHEILSAVGGFVDRHVWACVAVVALLVAYRLQIRLAGTRGRR